MLNTSRCSSEQRQHVRTGSAPGGVEVADASARAVVELAEQLGEDQLVDHCQVEVTRGSWEDNKFGIPGFEWGELNL
jgi:hypothetical protein